jgi:sporulation protein YlmC with PRC-barrel domain
MIKSRVSSTLLISLFVVAGAWAETGSDPVVGSVLTGVNAEMVNTKGYRATQLLGSGIYNDKGANIGVLEDFIVSSDKSISVAIVGVGGFLGVGDRSVAVPVDLFETNDKGQTVLPGASKEQLEALPAFIYAD